MNFWCFLVTPVISTSSPAASVLQHHWCINTNSISVSAESLHQQHTCIISISTSVASPHQQRHCISSILTSAVSAHHHLQCINNIIVKAGSVHQQNTCIGSISNVPKSLIFNARTRIIREFEEKCSYFCDFVIFL